MRTGKQCLYCRISNISSLFIDDTIDELNTGITDMY